MQSRGEAVDLAWMKDVIDQLQRQQPGAETRLLATRLAEIQGRMSPEQALSAHLAIAGEAGARRFTWDGVKDRKRNDSYYDPFGNPPNAQRARLEAARIYHLLGQHPGAATLRHSFGAGMRQSLHPAPLGRHLPSP